MSAWPKWEPQPATCPSCGPNAQWREKYHGNVSLTDTCGFPLGATLPPRLVRTCTKCGYSYSMEPYASPVGPHTESGT